MASDPVDHAAVAREAAAALVRLSGPIVAASTLPPEEVERAVAEQRAMVIDIASCMGSRDISVSAELGQGRAPDLVLARPVPAHLREIADPWWDSSDDVYRALDVERPHVRGRMTRPRAPPRPVFPEVTHEGRGGYVSFRGWRVYRYPIELVADGRFVIHYPAGNRSSDRAAHLAALEAMCRAEPQKWILERRDRGARSPV